MFKKKRGIKIPYNKQGLIYFICLDYKNQPPKIQNKIKSLCHTVGGEEYEQALFEFVTTEAGAIKISLKHYTSETSLYQMRKKFYELWK